MNKIVKKIITETSYVTGTYCLPPEFLSLIVTFRCNFRCKSCSIWQKTNRNELVEKEWLAIIPRLNILDPETFVEINGGEPLIRKDLVIKLIGELKKYFKCVALNSNGLLINEGIIELLENSGLDIIKISFYSMKKDIHNELRGNQEAYDRALNAIQLLSKSKIKLEIGILITAKNIKSIPGLIEHLKKYKNISIILQPLDESVESPETKNMNSNNLLMDLWPEKKDVTSFFDWIVNNRQCIKNSPTNLKAIKKYYLNPEGILGYRCFAGQRNVVVYPDGAVSLCFKGATVGNLRKKSLNTMLKGEKTIQERRRIKHCKKYCRIIGCNFSRGFKEYIKDTSPLP